MARESGRGTKRPADVSGSTDLIATPSPKLAEGGGDIWPAAEIVDIPPRAIMRHHLSDEVAHMLATLPRKNWDETTWAAFGGTLAAAPSAIDALLKGFSRHPFSLEWFEIIQVMILVGFLVWFFARKRQKGEKTSVELLEELRRGNEKPAQGGVGRE
jgi:hypothetical protein